MQADTQKYTFLRADKTFELGGDLLFKLSLGYPCMLHSVVLSLEVEWEGEIAEFLESSPYIGISHIYIKEVETDRYR
tara:strand:+ start:307 stop:537 length:231 start_codon:yes stop_codon:yes gene_type:complete